jgi:hypothetical protein
MDGHSEPERWKAPAVSAKIFYLPLDGRRNRHLFDAAQFNHDQAAEAWRHNHQRNLALWNSVAEVAPPPVIATCSPVVDGTIAVTRGV